MVKQRKRTLNKATKTELILIPLTIGIGFALRNLPNYLWVSSSQFIDSIAELNIGLIFAAFLTIYALQGSENIREASRHSSFIQPACRFIANSLGLCLLCSMEPPERWAKISTAIMAVQFLAFNIHVLYQIFILARDRK